MNPLAILPLLFASALAGHIIGEPVPQLTQEQNTATGEYGYSYSGGPSSKTEFRALDGTTTGAYSYVDAHGILQTVNYIADDLGFRASGSNIPTDGGVASLGHERRKRGIFAYAAPTAYAAAPAVVTTSVHSAPVATSSQSLYQVHNSAKLVHEYPLLAAHPIHSYLLRKKRGILGYQPTVYAAAPALAVEHHVPLATSSQSRFQIHNDAKIIQEVHQPLYAAHHVAAAPLAAVAAVEHHVPLATSSQSRFQVHNSAKIIQQVHQPLYAAHHLAPVHYGLLPAAAAVAPAHLEALPALPAHEALTADAVSVESA